MTDDPNQGSNSPDTGGADIDAICGTNLANSAPVAGDDAATFAVGEPYTINVLGNDSDPNGQALSVESVTQPTDAAGQVTFTPAGDVTFTPADPNFSGTVTFSYTISDGQGGRATATVTLTITAPSPSASASASASESESASASESETPSPSEQPSESASPSGSTSLEPSSSSEPVPSDEPSTSVSPSEGESASSEPSGPVELPSQEASRPPRPEEPTATVSPTEIPPTALPPTEIPATGGTVTIFDGADQVGQNGETIGSLNDLLANPDGVPLTIALETPATGGSLTLNPDNSYDYIPDSGFLGADAFAFRVTAPDGQSVVADVTLDVSDQCVDQPVAGGGAGTPAAMDAAVCGDLTATGAGQSIIVAGMSGSAPPTAPGGGQVPPAPQVPGAGTSGGTGPDGGGGAATGGQPATSQTGAPTLPDTGTGTTSSGSAGIVQQGMALMLAALVALLAVALLIRRWLT